MLIILSLYVVALWLVFSKFKIVRWGWLSGNHFAVYRRLHTCHIPKRMGRGLCLRTRRTVRKTVHGGKNARLTGLNR